MKKISNTNFLDEISDSSNDESNEKKTNESTDENSSFSFANTIYMINKIKFHNSFHNNVIYDFEAEEHLTFEKNRFRNEIRFASSDQWMSISNDSSIITDYGTMMIRDMLNDWLRELLFDNIVYVSDSDVTLMSVNVFQNKEFFWEMNDNSMFNKKTDQKICMLEKHFDFSILKFNVMLSNLLINAVQFRHFEKTISWIWHLRLDHCRFEIIQRFKKLNEIEMLIDEASKIVNCETCAINKMHEMINRVSTIKTIKSFEILHFDITINNIEFDEIKCIAHFTNEFISYSWVYFFINHKKATLFFVIKSLINQCDRADLTINAIVFVIRSDQETFIEEKLKTWISEQKIKWNWFAKNTSFQNEKFECFDVLLTEKIKYIKMYAKFFEKLYSECYLAAVYLINRTSIRFLNWKSSLMIIQRLTKQIIKWKIFHLKIFECKIFSLLKNADKSFKNEKMKSKTFIDYLINYDSINIFRVWNFEKCNVSDYKNVIFDEIQYYDTYEKNDLLKKTEKSDFIKFQTHDFKSSFNSINSDDEDWLKTPIREKNVFHEKISSDEKMKKIVDLISSSLFFDATAISRGFRIFMQLKTFDDISFMTFDSSENRYTKNEKKNRFFHFRFRVRNFHLFFIRLFRQSS